MNFIKISIIKHLLISFTFESTNKKFTILYESVFFSHLKFKHN